MKKSITIAMLLVVVIVIGTVTSAFAASTPKELDIKKIEAKEKYEDSSEKINYLVKEGIVEGYKDGELHLDDYISRAEMSKLIVFAFDKEDLAKEAQLSLNPYSDISQSHWANGIVSVGTKTPSSANGLYMLNGYPDRTFKPDKKLTYAELSKMLVVLTKDDLTTDMANNADGNWPDKWVNWARDIGIYNGIKIENINDKVSRKDAFIMFYNAISNINS